MVVAIESTGKLHRYQVHRCPLPDTQVSVNSALFFRINIRKMMKLSQQLSVAPAHYSHGISGSNDLDPAKGFM